MKTRHTLKPVYVCVLLVLSAQAALANPLNPTIVSGQASFATAGNALTVTNTPGAIINWQGFSIGANEITRFNQQSAASAVLNRVVSNNPSSILGALQSNGRVFLINPNGIVFGQGATVDVAGLVASTLNLSNADFLAGRYHFTSPLPLGEGQGMRVSNAGNIAAQSGGQIYLIAPNVENSGVITAPNGEILLAAGHSVDLVDTNNPNLRVNITAAAGDATNVGQLIATSGSLGLFGTVVKNSGSVNADSATLQGGRIVFKASQRVEAGGIISASGAGGGNIAVLADMQTGTVNVNGTLDASAPASGNGGFIETSAAHVNIADTASVTTAAAMGLAGTWLIDPFDYTIAATGGNMSGATLTASLTAGNVIIASTSGTTGTLGDVNVNDAVSWSANKLTLNAFNNININANLNGSGSASLALVYGQGAVTASNTSSYILKNGVQVNLPAGPNFSTKLGSDGVVKNYTVITALGLANSGTTTDLQGMSGNLAGRYALGGNIDATATSTWNAGAGFAPVGSYISFGCVGCFTGAFDGLGHTITGLTINRPATDYIGLFGYGKASAISNVGLVGGSVSGAFSVGGLAGTNFGTITNSYSTGNVSNSDTVGGLVGKNFGTITNSYSTGNVSGTFSVGGLVGHNGSVTTITNSYSTGSVTGSSSEVGGLVGFNQSGPITNSYSTGSVRGTANVGGLVGYNTGDPISNSYSTGSVSGSGSNGSVGGLAGYNGGAITKSYSTGTVTAPTSTFDVGGLVGFNGWIITDSYSTGAVSGGTRVGGLVGGNNGTITNSYSTGAVSGTTSVGGLAGFAWAGAITTSSYWDTQTSGQATSAGGTGLTTAQMMMQTNFVGWDFTNTWWMSDTNTRPFLRSEYSTTVNNAHQLQLMAINLGASYTLGANINMAELSQASGMWNTTTGFVPVGNLATNFTGTFDGLGRTVSNLTINMPATDNVGLFGSSATGSIVKNVGVTGVNITGRYSVGGLVGRNSGSVNNSFVTGSVHGTGSDGLGGLVGLNFNGSVNTSYAGATVIDSGIYSTGNFGTGGLVGWNLGGSVSNSYATGPVSGSNSVGGLLGAQSSGSVSNSYSTGAVTGGGGGLLGWNGGGTVSGSYWDTVMSGRLTSVAGTGLTTAQMKSMASFAGWNIANSGGAGAVWRIYEGNTYPLLTSFLTPLNVLPSYDGSGMALTNIGSYTLPTGADTSKILGSAANSLTLSSTAAGSYTASLDAGLYSTQQGYDFTVSRSIATPGSAAGNIVLSNPVAWTNGTLNISTTGTIYANAAISGGAGSVFNLQSGTWNQVGATLPAFNVGSFNFTGGTFIRALGGDGSTTPYRLADIYGVQGMAGMGVRASSFVLANNIDATATANWNAGAGFAPVGVNVDFPFTGQFDGQNHTISNLTITRYFTDNVGLFGYIGSGGVVSNVGLVDGNVIGNGVVGGLVGYSNGSIINAYATGIVRSNSNDVGGLVGYNNGSIINAYATGNVDGCYDGCRDNIGGLVGYNSNSGTISNSYSSGMTVSGYRSVGGLVGDNSGTITNTYSSGGTVSGSLDFGGLVGANWNRVNTSYSSNAVAAGGGGLIGWDEMGYLNNSYWDVQVSGRATSGGKEKGLTSAQMKTMSSFAGWSIANTGGAGMAWRIYEGSTAPLLTSFLAPLAVTANAATKTYDGAAYSGGNGVSYSVASPALSGTLAYGGTSQGAINAGSYVVAPTGLFSNQQGYDISFVNGALTIAAATAPAAAPAPAPAPINSVGFMADLVSTMLIPGGGASGSSQSTIESGNNKKPPATVVAVNGEILLAGSNEPPLPVCR